jgi:hypothetical protein
MDIQYELNKAKELLMKVMNAADGQYPKAAVMKLGKLIGQLETLQRQLR